MTTEATLFDLKQLDKQLIQRLLHACIREQLLPHTLIDNLLTIPLKRSKKNLLANNVQRFQLGKLKIQGDVVIVSQDQHHIITTVNELLTLIYQELNDVIDPAQWDKFAAEIINCNANDHLVANFRRSLNQHLAAEITQSHHHTLIQHIAAHYSAAEQLMFFEAWAAKGHPYHPCHKTKLGFSSKAYQKFSPEFNQDIHLPLAAIDKSMIHIESEENQFDYDYWFSQHYPEAWQLWQDKMHEQGLSVTQFSPLFIHPWQYENVITTLFHNVIKNKQLVYFKDACITTKASLSFRTLMVKNHSQQPHIKLPVAVHSTSAMRTISPASVHNGPKLGKILKKILTKENHFANHLQMAYEACGIHIHYSNPEIEKHLGIIYRDNPANLIQSDESPIVVAALFEESPINQVPLFIEIMQITAGNTLEGALEYFDEYCRIVIQAYLDLFLIYGIALEGHQQNTLAVFKHLRPVYMIARDLGGLRIHAPTLQEQGFDFTPHPNSATITDDRQEATNKFLHTVIQYHLGELVLLLSQQYNVSETLFWKVVKSVLMTRFHALKSRVNPERWQQEYQAIMQDDWQIKGLMRMRLHNVYNKYIYIHLKNPLRDA